MCHAVGKIFGLRALWQPTQVSTTIVCRRVRSRNDWMHSTSLPLAGSSALLRARGGDERELTLGELAERAKSHNSILPRATVLAELYARLARAIFLPFLPLIAFPLGLAAKRGRRAPGPPSWR